MPRFRVEQDFMLAGTSYFQVDADSLESAIEIVKRGEADAYKTKDWDYDVTGYDDSEQEG